LEYANLCFHALNVPYVSLDIAFNGKSFFLIEFQCLYFGSYTLTYSDFYWLRIGPGKFELKDGESILEKEYVNSVVKFVLNSENTLCK
jgi:hypothetical protein